MARGPGKRVVMNRAAVDALGLGWADGTQEVAEKILERARPRVADRPPIGQGLVKSGSAVTYVDGKKVASVGPTGAPRGAVPKQGVVTIVGYAFPGRFQEVGTVHQAARPVLTPAMVAEIQGGIAAIPRRILKRLANVRRNAT